MASQQAASIVLRDDTQTMADEHATFVVLKNGTDTKYQENTSRVCSKKQGQRSIERSNKREDGHKQAVGDEAIYEEAFQKFAEHKRKELKKKHPKWKTPRLTLATCMAWYKEPERVRNMYLRGAEYSLSRHSYKGPAVDFPPFTDVQVKKSTAAKAKNAGNARESPTSGKTAAQRSNAHDNEPSQSSTVDESWSSGTDFLEIPVSHSQWKPVTQDKRQMRQSQTFQNSGNATSAQHLEKQLHDWEKTDWDFPLWNPTEEEFDSVTSLTALSGSERTKFWQNAREPLRGLQSTQEVNQEPNPAWNNHHDHRSDGTNKTRLVGSKDVSSRQKNMCHKTTSNPGQTKRSSTHAPRHLRRNSVAGEIPPPSLSGHANSMQQMTNVSGRKSRPSPREISSHQNGGNAHYYTPRRGTKSRTYIKSSEVVSARFSGSTPQSRSSHSGRFDRASSFGQAFNILQANKTNDHMRHSLPSDSRILRCSNKPAKIAPPLTPAPRRPSKCHSIAGIPSKPKLASMSEYSRQSLNQRSARSRSVSLPRAQRGATIK